MSDPRVSDKMRGDVNPEWSAIIEEHTARLNDVAIQGALDSVVSVFRKWLWLPDAMPLLAVLGTIAANYLPGDPVWVGVVAPPSSAKTEILNAVSGLPNIHAAATITPGALLSGTPKREKAKSAKGGLLREINDFGILLLKDFGSVLSMRPDAKAELLAALREVYDGSWTRHLGTDGGQSLAWAGKVGLVFGVTPAIDSYHAVMGELGERFLLCRMEPAGRTQAGRALNHAGAGTAKMRRELAAVVDALFADHDVRTPRPLSEEERERLIDLSWLAVRIRSTVERDRYTREIESVHGNEGPARLALQLECLLNGLDVIGCERALAMCVVERVALDSVPPLRRHALDVVRAKGICDTRTIAENLRLPTTTVRRGLEELAAYGLVRHASGGAGNSDLWEIGDLA